MFKVNIDLDSKKIKRQRRANKDDASTAVGIEYINYNLRSLCQEDLGYRFFQISASDKVRNYLYFSTVLPPAAFHSCASLEIMENITVPGVVSRVRRKLNEGKRCERKSSKGSCQVSI